MNSQCLNEKLDPDTANMFEALDIIEKEGKCVKQFKTAFLNSSYQVKKQVRSSINSYIEILKEREETLCRKIDEHILQVVFWKEKSRSSFLLDDSTSDPDVSHIRMESLPTLKMKFVDDNENLEQKLHEFGSIQVERITNTDDWGYLDTKKNAMPNGFSPIIIGQARASSESSGSVESFEVIGDFESSEHPSNPVPKKVRCIRDMMYNEYSLSKPFPEPPLQHPAAALKNQLRPYHVDSLPKPSSDKSTPDSTTCDKQPAPSAIVKETFIEYLSNSEQDKWLSSTYKN